MWLRNSNGVLRGFDEDTFVEQRRRRTLYTPSDEVMPAIIERLRSVKGEALFLHSHLTDPHAPYDLGTRRGTQFARYLSEVKLVDVQLARLLEFLKTSPFYDRLMLIVSADHGEAFGEHSSYHHGSTLYDEALRVPLLFYLPGRTARKVSDFVSTIDLGATILDAFHQPIPGYFMGESLVPFLRGESPKLTRPILAEARLKQALVLQSGLKVILDTRNGRVELYDLKADPEELVDLSSQPELLREPLERLQGFFAVHTLTRDGYKPPYYR